ncbi:MAG: RNA polymerase sigma factor [Collinsella sp.]
MRADELPCDEVLADPSPGPGSADRLSAVRRAVRALPNEAREIVELKFDQLTAVEIARVTGLSRFAVARRIGSAPVGHQRPWPPRKGTHDGSHS